ncbi:MAG: hypothetical protein K2Y32_07655 [Candidatus Obscuribacterales bacterium]|nr:hypothetical protein [Candidatus Obscuribacterales bacterium]
MDLTLSLSMLALVFATIGLVWHRKPQQVKVIGLIVSACIFLSLLNPADRNWSSQSGILSLFVSASAFLSILSQQPRQQAAHSIASIVMLCSFSLAYLDERTVQPMQAISLALLLLTFIVLAVSSRKTKSIANCTAVFFSIAFLCFAASFFTTGIVKSLLILVVAAVLLPLLPFHAGFVGSLACLPGTVRAFAALVLPCLGWQIIATNLMPFPEPMLSTVIALSICGGVLSTIRAIAQIDIDQTFASVGTILFSLAWLNFVTKTGSADATGWYVLSVALAMNGLLLCTYHLREKYGDNLRDNLPGLEQTMPRLSLVFRILVMASAGFPPFALFIMTMSMMLTSNKVYIPIWVVVMSMICSLLLVSVMQQLLFGKRRVDLIYEDIRKSDVVALAILILLLFTSGAIPYTLDRLEKPEGAYRGTALPPLLTKRQVELFQSNAGMLIPVRMTGGDSTLC